MIKPAISSKTLFSKPWTMRINWSTPSKSVKKQWILTAIKCSVSVVLLHWVLQKTDLSEIFLALRSANLPFLMAALVVYFASYYIRSYRCRILLNAQKVEGSIPFLYQSYMVGIFFSNFLPSIVGGDVVRAYDIWRLGMSKSSALATVVVDRLLGLFGLILFAVSALLISPKLVTQLQLPSWWLFGIAVLFSVVWLLCRRLTLIRFGSRKLQHLLHRVTKAFGIFSNHQEALVKAFAWSLAVQITVILHYFLIEKALNISIPFGTFFLIVPLATLIMMLPVSINAIGLRESAFVFLLGAYGYGISSSEAIAFAWLAYGIVIIQGLLGGIIYALRQ